MVSSIGQSVALVTYANAALAGHDVDLDIASHPWFAYNSPWSFGIGRDGPILADNPLAWFKRLAQDGLTRAWLWVEPFDGDPGTIGRMAFVGGDRWAPVTSGNERDVIWHSNTSHDPTNKEKPWSTRLGGFQVMPGQKSVHATVSEAAEKLTSSLKEMVRFQETHRSDEAFFSDMFKRGMRHLDEVDKLLSSDSSGPAPDGLIEHKVEVLFPGGLYPSASYALMAAVDDSWAIGGMGWWNDWGSSDPTIQAECDALTGRYYAGMGLALYAACDVALERKPAT